jgi:hypothetical protein
MKICFLFFTNALSGGNFIAYRHAKYLKSQGHSISIVFEKFDENLARSYDLSEFDVHKNIDTAINIKFDLGIATFWITAFKILNFKCSQVAYFVQSDERRFNDENTSALERANRYAVEYTYKYFPGHIITIAKWLVDMFKNEFNREASYVPNGIDLLRFNKTVKPHRKRSIKKKVAAKHKA